MIDYTLIEVDMIYIKDLEFEVHFEAYTDDEDGSWAGDCVDILQVFLVCGSERADVTAVVINNPMFRDMAREQVIENKGH